MHLKPITAIVVLLLLSASLLVSGCTSSNNSNQAASSASPTASSAATTTANTTTSASASATPSASPSTSIVPTPTPTPTIVPTPTHLIATTTGVWAPSVNNPDTIFNPGPSNAIFPGWYCRAIVNAADGTHPCGLANWYIDNYAADGVWSNNAPGVNGLPGCSGGMGGGFAMLQLNAPDIAKLSPGYHTLKCDYLGDSKYAPSEWVGRFYVA